MSGKRQKLSTELQGKGSAHRGEIPLSLVGPDERREVPPAPKGLPSALLVVWEAFWADHVSVLIKPADAYDVGRYFLLLAEREKHERAIRAKPLVLGSMGQEVVNPRLTIVKELSREIEKTREHLGILPLSRIRLNIAEHSERASGLALLRQGLKQGDRRGDAIEAKADARPTVNLDEMA